LSEEKSDKPAKEGAAARKAPAKPRANDPRNRRTAIVAALRRCMMSKGYAETSLTDLAKAAQMSVSHLLYYYPGKEAVLLELADQVNARILVDVASNRDEPPEERIHVLADNVFVRGAFARAELVVVRELVALAMHRPELRKHLGEYNTAMMAYLEDLFAKTPRQPGQSAADAALVAAAVWMGLVNNADFEERLTASTARRLFRRTLLSLANLGAAENPAPKSPAKPRMRKTKATAR
jgi:AcrR family transcriptional regulator